MTQNQDVLRQPWRQMMLQVTLVCCGLALISSSARVVAQNTSIVDVSPRPGTFIPPDPTHSSSGRVLSLVVAADGQRLYAGTLAGVWRSDDSGATWRQMTRPQPPQGTAVVPGALPV